MTHDTFSQALIDYFDIFFGDILQEIEFSAN